MNLVQIPHRFLDLSLVRKGFLALSLGVFPLILLDGLWVMFREGRTINQEASFSSQITREKTSLETLSFYEALFDKDTVFGKVSTSEGAIAVKVSLSEVLKDYRLKGVVLAKEPEAIFENAATQKTLFVKVGDEIDDVDVKEIQEGFVVMSYLGEEKRFEIL